MIKRVFVSIAFLCVVAAPARAQEAVQLYEQGLESTLAYKKIELFTRALQLDPNFLQAYEQRAKSYYFRRWFDHAARDYLKVTEFKPRSPEAHLMLGRAYLWKERSRGIKGEFKRLRSRLLQKNAPSYSESLDRAIESLSRAIELDPNLAAAYSRRAEAYCIKGMTAAALRDAEAAIGLGGDRRSIAKAYAAMARVYQLEGKTELSDVNFRRSIETDPYLSDFPPLHVPLLHPGFGNTSSPEPVGRMGLLGIIIVVFAIVFKLVLPAPQKDKNK